MKQFFKLSVKLYKDKEENDMRTKLISIIVISLILGTLNIASSAEHILKIAGIASPKQACMYAGVLFEQEVEKRSKGKIDVQFFHSAQLGGEVEILDKLKVGVLQGSLNSGLLISRIHPFANVLELPYLFPNWEKVDVFVRSDLGSQVLDSLAKVDLKGLGYTSYGFHTLATNKPFKSLDDLNKFKFRSAEAELSMDILKLLGISPTALPFAEVYQALRTGVIEGIDNTPNVIDLVKWGEVVKYVADTNHWFGWYVFLIKKSWLEGLPADLQKIIIEVGREACEQTMRMAQEQHVEALAKFDKMGITLVKLSDDERTKFKRRLHPLHEKYGKAIGEDFLQKMYKLLDYKK